MQRKTSKCGKVLLQRRLRYPDDHHGYRTEIGWDAIQGSPGVGHKTLFLSSPHLCFITVFNCDLFVSRDDPLMS